MKNLLSLVLLFAFVSVFAGTHDRTRTLTNIKAYSGGTGSETYKQLGVSNFAADTLVVSDTLTFPIQFDRVEDVYPYFTTTYTKVGAATATITINYLQSNDGANYFTVKKGKAQAAYTKSVSVTASTTADYSFKRDTAYLEGRFLKVQYISSSTASVKVNIGNFVKVNIK